jgi:hypothetical protein
VWQCSEEAAETHLAVERPLLGLHGGVGLNLQRLDAVRCPLVHRRHLQATHPHSTLDQSVGV